jgi:lysozyme
MTYRDIAERELAIDEGRKNRMYLDSEGIETIGIGHNLRDRPISDRAVRVIFEDDFAVAEADARRLAHNFDDLSAVRKAVICNMSFNLGFDRLAKFVNTLRAINEGRFGDAATERLDSAWARQVGDRAKRLAAHMRSGT